MRAAAVRGTIRAASHVMSMVRLPLAVALLLLPAAASAQPWADAYKAGDYKKAADILHPLVIQLATQFERYEPDPPRYLSMMYAEGLGVSKDPIASCSLAQVAMQSTMSSAPKFAQNTPAYDEAVKEANGFLSTHCDGLSEWDRMAAANLCFAFGMPEAVLTVGSDTVRVGRGGVHLADAMPDRPDQIVGCPMLIARVRPWTIAPPADAAPGVAARHFVDLLFWRPIHRPGDPPRFALQWEMFEVQKHKVEMVLMEEQLDTIDGWPTPALPRSFDGRLTVQMVPSGNVGWKLTGEPPRRGWILTPRGEDR
jgi:hypothetical protein